jgi:hypothetical protein
VCLCDFLTIFQMNIEGDNLICACLQGISQNLINDGRSHESNVKYMKTLESLFLTWFGNSIDDEYRRWCEHLNQGRGVHADIFQDTSLLVFRDRNFWKTAAFEHIDRHIQQNKKMLSSEASKSSSVRKLVAARPNSMYPVRCLNLLLGDVALKDEDVKCRSLDALSLHSGHPTCVSAGPQLPDNRQIIAVAYEDLTLQVVEFKDNTLKVLSTTRFEPSATVQTDIDVVSIYKTHFIQRADLCAGLSSDAFSELPPFWGCG